MHTEKFLTKKTPPSAVVRVLLEYILKHNYFEFMGQYYLQTLGTAMGTKAAPSFVGLFMGKFEK